MFDYFKKSILFFLCISILPSTHAMENNSSWLSRIYATFSLPSIPSKFFGYQIRRQSSEEQKYNSETKKMNTDSDKELPIANKISGIDKDKLPTAIAVAYVVSLCKQKVNEALLQTTINSILKKRGTKEEDWKKLKQCIECGADPDTIFGADNTPLLSLVARCRKKDLFSYLLGRGANRNACDKYGWTPDDVTNANVLLSHRIQNGHSEKEIIECILHGADPNLEIGVKKIPPLLIAVKNKQADLVNCLLQHGANPNVYGEKIYPPLFEILLPENWDDEGKLDKIAMKILENLLQYHADPNVGCLFYIVPLKKQIIKDNKVLKLFINYRYRDCSALLECEIMAGRPNRIKRLCMAGAPLTDIDSFGNTVFHSMLSNSSPKQNFETVITCARPQQQMEHNKREAMQRTVRAAIWALKYDYVKSDFSRLSEETRLYILSKFSEDHFNNSSGALYKALYKTVLPTELPINYEQSDLLGKTKERVLWLADILKTKNRKNKTAFQELFECEDQNYINEIAPLLNGGQTIKDHYNLLVENPDMLNFDYLEKNPEKVQEVEKNLALKIANNIKSEIVYINK